MKTVAHFSSALNEKNSALFYKPFRNDQVHTTVLTVQGSDDKFLPREVAEYIYRVKQNLIVRDKVLRIILKDVSGNRCVECNQQV